MPFFIPFPFPNFGNGFFHSLPVPEIWEWIFFIPFPFPKFGIGFFYSLLVPKFWEWAFSIPFPFPNFGNGIFYSCSRSRTLKSHSRSPLKYSFRWQPFVTCFFWHHGAIPNHCNFASSFDGNLRAYLKMHHFTFRRKAVLTHFNCDWCGKLLFLTRFWESNATFWRQTVSTCNHATCVIILHLVQTIWDSIQNIQWRKINKCSQCDCIIRGRQFEGTFKNTCRPPKCNVASTPVWSQNGTSKVSPTNLQMDWRTDGLG